MISWFLSIVAGSAALAMVYMLNKYRHEKLFCLSLSFILGGALAGLAGTWFTLEWVGVFNLQMTSGRGFIALAAMIFGRWTPFGAFIAALIFGLAQALQIRAQTSGLDILEVQVPYQFLVMAPYILTMLVLAGFGGRARPPAADGIPYEK